MLGSRGNILFLDLLATGSAKRGKFVVRSEKKSSTNENVSIQLSGIQMTNFGVFGSIVPQVIIWKPIMPQELAQQYINNPDYLDENMLKSCQWVKVWESPAMRGNNCVFPVANFDSSKLCSGNPNFPIRVKLFDFNFFNFFRLNL